MAIEQLKPPLLTPWPIDPNWVITGDPQARGAGIATTADDSVSMIMWDCTAGSFNWFYDIDEMIHVVEGTAVIRTMTGSTYRLQAGNSHLFEKGTMALWVVEKYVRKIAVLHEPLSKRVLLRRLIK